MMQSDEKLSSHQSLAPNIAAMYALSGKQTAPATGQKTVKRDDVAIREVKLETIQYCTMSDSWLRASASKAARARQPTEP